MRYLRYTFIYSLMIICSSAQASSYIGLVDNFQVQSANLSWASPLGVNSAVCLLTVQKVQVTNQASCVVSTSPPDKYFYIWDCDAVQYKSFTALVMAANMSKRSVTLYGTGTCPVGNVEGVVRMVTNPN